MLKLALLLAMMLQGTTVKPLNSTAVAVGCTSTTTCTYVDTAVPPGPHFYFVLASTSTEYSVPSNSVNVVVPAGTHNVTLNWVPSTTPGVGYWVYRGAPPTNLGVTSSN